ncbi:hypothetical protein MACH09_18320 [Vibrio sp. MACH09]|uniref:hypothetical protein n=1 Tax=unclassified Vibrio TaxID=2614977 RepID=UPI0014937961|nr:MULTISPECIES: hypothetical protein [unclassified Vibrio]NOI66744.1 hypothetical protein [Vibrio sp. 99-8-1]GLO61324.1 hypothetical protein MACH09_18320 [Vibrio sp. MACH09]
MTSESTELVNAYRIILLALDEMVKAGGQPRYEGDDSSTDPEAFKRLVMQYAGDRISESAIDEALKVPLQDIAGKLMALSAK